MEIEKYKEIYIDCYDKVLDITKMIKDFLYPDEYVFIRLNETYSVDEKIQKIKSDLESLSFTTEVPEELLRYLEIYFPNDNSTDEEMGKLIESDFRDHLDVIKFKLKTRYIPFIKMVSILNYKDANLDKHYNDDQAWAMILNNESEVADIECRISDVIWGYSDTSRDDIVDNFLKEYYKLNEIEFNRYINGLEKESESIIKTVSNEEKLRVNFKLFDKHFNDIVGQDEAIKRIRKTLLRSILLYNAEELEEKTESSNSGPLATFMFYGPTGTGKTETAKRMAKFVYGSNNKMLILDMNSYKDPKVSASAIKGHPEGYVDSAKGTDFTRFLQKNNNGIIVLDEFEKASNEARELFMTMLDEGKFKDALGNNYDLSGYIFIATTNVSSVFENKPKTIGFSTNDVTKVNKNEEEKIKEELRKIFTAPIMNRFNNVIGFNAIKKEDAKIICENLINKLVESFESKKFRGIVPKITIENIDEIIEIVLEEANFKKDGVRSLKNVINDMFSSQILEEIVDEKDKILVSVKNGEIVVSENIEKTIKRNR